MGDRSPWILFISRYRFKVFSEGFSEARTKDINGGFPSDTLDYIDDYDYFSDSDLEDEAEKDGEPAGDDELELQHSSQDSESRVPPTTTPGNPQLLQNPNQVGNHHTSDSDFAWLFQFSL